VLHWLAFEPRPVERQQKVIHKEFATPNYKDADGQSVSLDTVNGKIAVHAREAA